MSNRQKAKIATQVILVMLFTAAFGMFLSYLYHRSIEAVETNSVVISNATATTANASQRKLARATNGDLYAVYSRSDGTNQQIYYAKSTDNGANWTEQGLVHASVAAEQREPAIAIDASDNLYVAWTGKGWGTTGTANFNIQYRKYNKATLLWSTQESVTDTANDQFAPGLALDLSNNVHAAWYGKGWGTGARTAYNNIQYSKRATSSADWATNREGVTDVANDQFAPGLALDSSNNVHAAWYGTGWGTNTANNNIQYRKKTATWQIQESVTDSASAQLSPSLALDSSNNIHVVWYGTGWGTTGIASNNIQYSKRATSSADWATNREGVTDVAYDQLSPSLALDSADYVYVVWAGKGWGTTGIANNNIQSRKRTTSWQAQAAITDLAADQTNPALLWHLQPKIFTSVKTNLITSGCSFIWTTGAGAKFYASDAIIWPQVYFVLTPSSSTPTAGTSPTVTITATKKDAAGADVTVTGYNVATTVSVSITGSAQITAPSTGTSISLSNTNFTSGAATVTITDNTAQSVTVTATDQSNTSIAGTAAVSFQPAAANKLILNAPADIDAGTRAAYTVTLADTYNNNVNAGVGGQVVYLFSTSTSANKKFYDAASGGNVITSVTIAQGSSMASVWYYDDTAGTYTITASDATPANGATGLADATDSIAINSLAAIASYTVSANSPQTVGTGWQETVTAKDAFGNTVTTAGTQVTLSSNKVSSPALSNAGGANWTYRKKITVSPSAGAGTGYQVKVTVYYGAGADSAGVAYLNSHSQSNFNDIRFTDSTGTAAGELSHWQESKTDGNNAVYWIKVADDLSTTAKDIYIYYGNASATVSSYNSGANTFPAFFDDFTGSDLNPAIWTCGKYQSVSYGGGSCNVLNSVVTVTGGTNTWWGMFAAGAAFSSPPFIIEYYARSGQIAGYLGVQSSGSAVTSSQEWVSFDIGSGGYYSANNGVGNVEGTLPSLSSWSLLRADVYSGGVKYFINRSPLAYTKTTNVPDGGMKVSIADAQPANSIDVDWVFIRKYASPESAPGVPGVEQVNTGDTSSAKFYTSPENANSDTGGLASLPYTLSSGVVPVYVRDNKVELIVLTATDTLIKTGTSSAINVGVAPANKIVFTSTAQTLVAGAASAAYTVEVRDQYDNLRSSDALALTLSSSSGVGKFDTSAAGAFNGTVTSITTVNGVGTFYYKDTVTGTPTITVSRSSAPVLVSGTQQQTITAGSISPTITHSSYKAGATPSTTISFTTANPIPFNGDIEVIFPDTYDLSGTLGVSGHSGATVSSFNQTLIIDLGATAGINAGASVSLVVSGIKNPLVLGATGTYAVKTQDASDALIDQGTVAANTITIVTPTITLLTPSAAGITVGNTQSYAVTWSNDGAISDNISLYYANEGGTVYPGSPNIASAVANSGTYTWTVPDDPRLATKVKIEDVFYQVMKETTDTQFNQGTYTNTQVTGTGNAAGVVITAGSITTLSNSGGGDWLYRKKITVSPSAGAGTGYQVKLTVNYGTGTDSAGVAYLNSKCQSSFNDIRFTDSTGTAAGELSHWQESSTPGNNAVYWIKINDDLSTTAKDIYIYYGNSSAATSTYNNGTNTFDFFDDFNSGTTPDTNKWTINDPTGWSVGGGYLTGTSSSGRISSIATFSSGVILEIKYYKAANGEGHMYGGFFGSTSNNIGLFQHPSYDTTWKDVVNGFTLTWVGVSRLPTATWLLHRFAVTSASNVDFQTMQYTNQSNIYVYNHAVSKSVSSLKIAIGRRYDDAFPGYAYNAQWDWIRVRKYAATEPSPGTPGNEQYAGPGIFTSRALDTGGSQNFGKLEWTANIPAQCGANAVQLQVAANNDNLTWNFVGPDGTAAAYFTVSGTSIPATLNGLRYIKYKAYLATADVNYTPTLQEVKIGFASPTTANRVISSESANTFIMAGKTSAYYLSAPADIVAGNTAQYTVTRKDSKGTLVTVGAEVVTLASTSTGANKQFRATAGGAALSPSEITIPNGSSSVDFYYYDEKMGAYSIITSRTGVTSATDTINVLHAAADHLRFQNNVTTPQKVGVSFTLPLIEAVDQYGNILNSDYGAAAYAGAKTISYSLSGLANAPNGTPVDSWTTSVPFTNGISNVTTDLITTLYRAQTTTIAPNDPLLPALTANAASNAIVVNPELAVSLKFVQQPSAAGIINTVLAQQPAVSVQDTYGNQTHDTTAVTLYDSTSGSAYVDGTGALSAAANPVSAVDGLATFSGLKYSGFPDSASSIIYLYSQATGLAPGYSNAITFNVASTSTVGAVTAPAANFNLIPTNDTEAEKFAVLKFKVTDAGDDGIPTLIDGVKIAIGGTGLNASTDIAWAELYDDTGASRVSSVTGSAITNTQILFGAAANSNSLAGLGASVANGASRDYTVYIYMKPGKLTAVEGNTYTFDIDETGVYADLAYSSKMAADSLAVAPVTGTIKVDTSHIEVATEAGASSLNLTAGVGANIILRATDANKNIDSNYTGNHTFIFSGLNSITTYNPKVDVTSFGVNKTIGFTNGVSTAALLKAYKKETGAVSVTESGQSYLCHPLSVDVAAVSASKIAIASGNTQASAINTALLQPYVAFISDLYGNPASGVSANFGIASVPSGATGQSLSVVSGSSDTNGQVSTILTTGNLAGTYAVSVTSTGLTGSPLSFTSNALAPSAMNKVSGDSPSGKKVTEILAPFVVQVVDAASTPVPNATVNFTIASAPSGATGQALSAAQAVTDSAGQASTVLTLGNKTGTYTVTASYLSYTQTFTVTANPQPPYKVLLSGPSAVNAGAASLVFTMNIQDQYNNASPVSANTVFNLTNSPSATGGFYSDSAATISLGTQITVASAASSNTFYYKDTVTGNPLIAVSRASGDTLTTAEASLSLSVTPAGLTYFKVTGSAATMTTGDSRVITVTAYDTHGNIKTDADSVINIVFSGANSSPSSGAPTCTNNAAADIAFGTSTALNFVNGVATSTFKAYKAETAHIKATAGAATTSDANDLDIIVKHAAVDHLKFSTAFIEPQGGFKAGTAFTLSALNAVDLYGNICDGANGAAAYSGTKTITYALSGTANAPDGSAFDAYINSVVFAAGVSTSTLDTTLYRAQATTITASDAALTGTNAASGLITINPKPISKLFFTRQPSTVSLTNVALAQQPIVSVSDMYGNAVSSASDQITLKASTTSGTYTAAANGTLSGQALSLTLTSGSAAFSGIKYSYPESIYLKASAANAAVTDIYSFGIVFGTAATDGTLVAGALVEPAEISSTVYSDESRVNVFDFKVVDAGTDGFGIPIKQIKINRNTLTDTTGGWSTYIAGAKISDGTTTLLGTITDNALTFGAGTSTIYTVANAGNKTFTLSIYLKQSLPAGADGKFLAFSIDPNDDVTLDTVGSKFAAAGALSSSSKVQVTISKFMFSASASGAAAGNGITVNIKGTDINGNIDSDYAGDKEIIFSGANAALTGTKPTCTNYSGIGVDFGGITLVSFASGESSSTITMKLYKAETAAIKATTSDSLIVTSAADALNITVTGGSASKLSWLTQPSSTVVANAPWKSFGIGVTDVYGNTTSSAITVTVAPTGGTLSAGAVNSAAAASGVATFSNFAVSCTSYPGTVTLSATAAGVTGSGPSNNVTVAEKYAITIKTLDSVNGSALTAITLKILDAGTGALVTGLTNPVTGNSPFNLSLPYGKYQFNITKDAYVESTTEKTPLPSDDGADGTYDNNISWTIFVMSVSESLADYKIVNNFIYDEDLDQIVANLRLEKRGKQIVDDSINTLKRCTLDIYNSSDVATPIYSASLDLPDSRGIYWFYITNATGSGKFISGKSYFTKMTLKYGGDTESNNTTYSSVSTFDIGVTARLKTWTSEIKTEVAGVKSTVSTEARAIEKTVKDKVAEEAEATRTKVSEKATEIKAETAKILTAAETTIPSKITTAQQAISTTLTTEVKPHIKSAILNRENMIRTGDTITIRYRTVTGVSPTLSIYDPKNALKVSAAAMKEVGTTGVYEYTVKFLNAWGTGEFTIVCSESTQGTVDAQVISVTKHDIEEVAGQVSAVLGSTSGITGLKSVTDTIGLQFNDMDKLLAKISKDVAGKLGDAKSAVNDLAVAFKQLEDMSKQIKNIGGTKGINLEKLYEVSKDKKEDIAYIKNKSEELKAAMEINQKMIENVAKKPVVQTWFEFK